MILKDLWSGRFYPAETVVPTDPKYREINRGISESMEHLKAQLPREQFTLVEQILEQMTLAHSMELESPAGSVLRPGPGRYPGVGGGAN